MLAEDAILRTAVSAAIYGLLIAHRSQRQLMDGGRSDLFCLDITLFLLLVVSYKTLSYNSFFLMRNLGLIAMLKLITTIFNLSPFRQLPVNIAVVRSRVVIVKFHHAFCQRAVRRREVWIFFNHISEYGGSIGKILFVKIRETKVVTGVGVLFT